jgi:hypothetical protein
MESLYFLGIALGGGCLALFVSAGWGSFKHKKVPEKAILFRWFVAGLVASGLLGYAWIFGSGGDVSGMIQRISETLDVDTVMKAVSLTALTTGITKKDEKEEKETEEEKKETLQVGMPSF